MERAATSVAVWLDLLVGEEHLHFHPRGISIPETYLSLRVSDLRWKILTHMTAIVLKNVRKTFRRRAEVGFSRKRGERREVLREIRLEDRGVDQFQSYSTGMRRRVALVRALLSDAPVLLLDEPTLGVDPWSTENIHNYLLELAKQGKTILCATNNPAEARALGGRSCMLEEGVIVASTTEEIIAS